MLSLCQQHGAHLQALVSAHSGCAATEGELMGVLGRVQAPAVLDGTCSAHGG